MVYPHPDAVACWQFVSLLGAATLSTLLKVMIGRPRPTCATPVAHGAGMSFPSGHALTSVVAVGVFTAVLPPATSRFARRWCAAFGVLAAPRGSASWWVRFGARSVVGRRPLNEWLESLQTHVRLAVIRANPGGNLDLDVERSVLTLVADRSVFCEGRE